MIRSMADLNVLKLTIIVSMLLTIGKIEGALVTNSRKLDETTTPPNLENKCGGCPCNNPCNTPPSLPPPSPPPPAKKSPPSNNCPPPPTGGGGGQYPQNAPFIYINGPPGNLYPVDAYYSGSTSRFPSGLFPFSITTCFVLLFTFMW